MIQPLIVGQIVSVDQEDKSFKDRVSGKTEEYTTTSIGVVCSVPSKGVITVVIFGDCSPLPSVLTEGKKVNIKLSSYVIEKGFPTAKANINDIDEVIK